MVVLDDVYHGASEGIHAYLNKYCFKAAWRSMAGARQARSGLLLLKSGLRGNRTEGILVQGHAFKQPRKASPSQLES
jgi:hypothetical protein